MLLVRPSYCLAALLSLIACLEGTHGFLPSSLPPSHALRSSSSSISALSMQSGPVDRRSALLSAVALPSLAALTLRGEQAAAAPVTTGGPQAACTWNSCPPPTGEVTLDLLEVKKGKFTGKGYSIQKPTDDTFKRVISPASLANPGGVLFRDKLDSDTAVYSVVTAIKAGQGAGAFKPGIVDSYTKEFGDRFKLITQEGPVKKGGADYWYVEYKVETTIAGAQEQVHFYSAFAAGEKDVYVVNAQTKEKNVPTIGKTLEAVAKSLIVNE
mmetsp:Transcript_18296/g.35681  ORF Transcript_18296/g.35681 Transcript_18296/m.35681 type:complete len:269 (-) Transcript_18296:206-1012(-)